MDVSRGRTEAAESYKSRSVLMDKQIQIASVAHTILGKMVEGQNGDRILGALYVDMAGASRVVHRVPDAALSVIAGSRRSVAFRSRQYTMISNGPAGTYSLMPWSFGNRIGIQYSAE